MGWTDRSGPTVPEANRAEGSGEAHKQRRIDPPSPHRKQLHARSATSGPYSAGPHANSSSRLVAR